MLFCFVYPGVNKVGSFKRLPNTHFLAFALRLFACVDITRSFLLIFLFCFLVTSTFEIYRLFYYNTKYTLNCCNCEVLFGIFFYCRQYFIRFLLSLSSRASKCNIKCRVVLGRNLLPLCFCLCVFVCMYVCVISVISLNINFDLFYRNNSLRFDSDTGLRL